LVSVEVNGVLAELVGTNFSVPLPLTEGSNDFVALARDSQGRETLSSSITVVRDTQPPELSFHPPYGSNISSDDAVVRILYSDLGSGVDVTTLRLFLDDVEVTGQALVDGSEALLPLQQPIAVGEYVLRAEIADLAGHVKRGLTLFFYEDAPPILSNLKLLREYFCPAPNPYDDPANAEVTLTFDLSEGSSVSLEAMGEQGVVVSHRSYGSLLSGSNEVRWDGKTDYGRFLKPGHYRLELKATDLQGNVSVPATVFVRVIF
jgi:hypothetical protein